MKLFRHSRHAFGRNFTRSMHRNYTTQMPVTLIEGDGIGPEITKSVVSILNHAKVPIRFEQEEVGEKAYLSGYTAGIRPDTIERIRKNKLVLKAPITTPQGGGYKSLNVTLRKTLGLYSNLRPVKSYAPFVPTKHPNMDVVIVRENEEDLYAGIEHQQTDQVVQCLKLITRPGCEKICQYAFEYARRHNRKKVTCFVKDNIMKKTDGLFAEVFRETAKNYPDIGSETMIIDIATSWLADDPQRFDVIVTSNLYGDIISDVAAQIAGSVGMAGSANIGNEVAMFEAIHGSAPPLAGKNVANPSGFLNGALIMLQHIGAVEQAELIENAWLKTIEDGVHTQDIYQEGTSTKKASTSDFTKAIMERFGEKPSQLKPSQISQQQGMREWRPQLSEKATQPGKRERVGIDLFVCSRDNPENLGGGLKNLPMPQGMTLRLITNRGVKVWPDRVPETFLTDHYRCRFRCDRPLSGTELAEFVLNAEKQGFEVIKTEGLYRINGEDAFSLGQGE